MRKEDRLELKQQIIFRLNNWWNVKKHQIYLEKAPKPSSRFYICIADHIKTLTAQITVTDKNINYTVARELSIAVIEQFHVGFGTGPELFFSRVADEICQQMADANSEAFYEAHGIFEKEEKMAIKKYPKQAVIILSNGETAVVNTKVVNISQCSPYLSQEIKIEGSITDPSNLISDSWGESCYISKVLDEWKAALRPELTYKSIIFNRPATIVLWADGTKTTVKCSPKDTWDPEKGLALCFMKKALGNKGNFNNVLKRGVAHSWIEDYYILQEQGMSEGEIAKALLGEWATVAALRSKKAYELKKIKERVQAEKEKKEDKKTDENA